MRLRVCPDKVCAEQNGARDGIMADDTNMKSHVATYGSMIGVMKWGAMACALLVAIVIWLIA
ncbi:hypothetical protein ASE72_05815 [Sphingomonas sp. Leaf20]|nr:hypothetical protein ASE72_05815 [Sphingomonas sp. Leaf20]